MEDRSDYDKNASTEENVISDNKMYAMQVDLRLTTIRLITLLFIIITMIENMMNKALKINITVSPSPQKLREI